MFWQGAAVEFFRRRHGDAVAVDEGVLPVGGGTAASAVELIEAVIEWSAFDAA